MARTPDWAALENGILSLYRCLHSEETLREVSRVAREALGAGETRVYLYDEEWQDLYVPAGPEVEPLRFPLGEGAAGVSAENATWYVVDRPDKDPVYQPAVDLEGGWILAVPAVDGNDALTGVLEMAFPSQQSKEFIQAGLQLGHHLGNAFVVTRRQEETESFCRGLALSYGTAVDALQISRSDHSQRVARYAVALAKAMKLPAGRVCLVEIAAFLHDVGRVFLAGGPAPDEPPPAYLHVILAEAFLGMIEPPEQFADLSRIVSEHHEHWDGTGHPKGLKGGNTLVESRILLAATDFDSLLHGWLVPGRKLTEEEALAFVRGESGKRYDPEVIKAFVEHKVYEMNLRAHERYRYSTPVEVENLSRPDQDRFEGEAVDISEGGLLIESDRPQEVGDLLRLFIYLPSGEPLEAIVRVVRTTARAESGFDIGVHYIWHASQG